MSAKAKAWLHIALFLLTLLVNALGALGLINGASLHQVSEEYSNLLSPSFFTFYIWGLTYFALMASLVWMLVRSGIDKAQAMINRLSHPFIVSCLLNMAWVLAFCYRKIWASVALTLMNTVIIALINLRLKPLSGKGWRLSALAFGLYGGWLTATAILNVAYLLVALKWDGFGVSPVTWTLATLGFSILLTILIQGRLSNAALPLSLGWLCVGIWHRHSPEGALAYAHPAIAAAAALLAVAYLFLAAAVFVMNGKAVLPFYKPRNKGAQTEEPA